MTRVAFLVALIGVCLGAGACSKNIGDSCTANVDCKIDGTRFCDVAPPGGYCTVEGCDVDPDTCPVEAVCISFYTPIFDQPCNYDPCNSIGQAATTPGGVGACNADERCVCDQTDDHDVASMTCPENGLDGIACSSVTAHCATENSERRWCMKKCSNNGDCRDHYECRATGTLGAEPVASASHPYGQPAKFCVSDGTEINNI
jgi:hypothetical protein